MLNLATIKKNLQHHVKIFSSEIGERNIYLPEKLKSAENYINGCIKTYGLNYERQAYNYHHTEVANIIAFKPDTTIDGYYLIGAHYDTERGSPGADDNASALSVLLECCRLFSEKNLSTPMKFVFFTLEENPAYHTPKMGSTVFARTAREKNETIIGSIILEMVGYTAEKQTYPFPLNLFGYKNSGDFLGIIGNYHSRDFCNKVIEIFNRNNNLPIQKAIFPGKGKILPVSRKSDHASFWDYNYKSLMLTDTSFLRNPHYHKKSDTHDTLDYDYMAQLVLNLFNFMVCIKEFPHH